MIGPNILNFNLSLSMKNAEEAVESSILATLIFGFGRECRRNIYLFRRNPSELFVFSSATRLVIAAFCRRSQTRYHRQMRTERVDQYWSTRFGLERSDLYREGITVIPHAQQRQPWENNFAYVFVLRDDVHLVRRFSRGGRNA